MTLLSLLHVPSSYKFTHNQCLLIHSTNQNFDFRQNFCQPLLFLQIIQMMVSNDIRSFGYIRKGCSNLLVYSIAAYTLTLTWASHSHLYMCSYWQSCCPDQCSLSNIHHCRDWLSDWCYYFGEKKVGYVGVHFNSTCNLTPARLA